MTDRKAKTARRRRVPHNCGTLDCELILEIGPPRPRPAVGEPVALDWFSLSRADQYAHAFGTLEEAEAAWQHHREGMAAYARTQLAKGEQLPEPVAAKVFEPDATWPPPAAPAAEKLTGQAF
jgi:hypothetical protein